MFRLSDRAYTILKWTIILLLPAIGTAYFALSELYGLPFAKEVQGTCSIIAIFLGTIFSISSAEYNKDDRVRELEDIIAQLKNERKQKENATQEAIAS